LIGTGVTLLTDRSTVAVMEAKSPASNVNWVGNTTIEYTSLVPGWVLLLTPLLQLVSRPAHPINRRMDNRFMVCT
jgi:hypothetical protein